MAADRGDLGIEFLASEALEEFRRAGQRVEDQKVFLDPEFVLEQVAKAPREFELQARNPAHTVTVGGRHLDMVFALQTLSDKPYMGSVTSGANAADTIRMGEIVFGGREAIERAPASISLIHANSPLRFDDRMLGALMEYCRANQAVIVTPFLLMGAMSPVSIPSTLVQQMVDALAGIALTQLMRPGCPVVFGSFLSSTDMQSGSPSFGTPESAVGLLCTGQIARSFGLPWRSGGGLTASQTADVQAAHEALTTMLPTFLAGTNFVMHAAGWLEGGSSRASRSTSSTSSCCGCPSGAARTPPSAPERSGGRRSRTTSSRRWTPPSGPSSKSSSYAAGASWATDRQRAAPTGAAASRSRVMAGSKSGSSATVNGRSTPSLRMASSVPGAATATGR
jgi:trimethylamine:corrinoid methyltransferase-like protein